MKITKNIFGMKADLEVEEIIKLFDLMGSEYFEIKSKKDKKRKDEKPVLPD